MSVNSKMTAIADEIRTLAGITKTVSLDEIAKSVDDANTEINLQTDKLDQIVAALENKVSKTVTLQKKTITPSASEQVVTFDSGYDGLSRVTIAGDTDLVPSNIADGVNIFGVEGTHKGGSDIQNTRAALLVPNGSAVHYVRRIYYDENTGAIVYDNNNE